ncbi:MAG: TIGR03546 family protein [Elusimicrobia bacterium]|nr:TIGR03546 family protein [Elusimicrobiota bacterium]
MIWIKLIKKLFKALNADASPAEIAAGVILGSVIGLTPAFALHNLLVVALIIVLRVNVSAAVFSSLLFSAVGAGIDPVSHIVGKKLLLAPGLNGFWTSLYNVPVAPLLAFNNTVVLGSLVLSLVLMIPLFLFTKRFVIVYRERLQEKVQKFKLVKLLKASRLYKLYERFKS